MFDVLTHYRKLRKSQQNWLTQHLLTNASPEVGAMLLGGRLVYMSSFKKIIFLFLEGKVNITDVFILASLSFSLPGWNSFLRQRWSGSHKDLPASPHQVLGLDIHCSNTLVVFKMSLFIFANQSHHHRTLAMLEDEKARTLKQRKSEHLCLKHMFKTHIWEATVRSLHLSWWHDSLLASEPCLCMDVPSTLRRKMIVWEHKLRCWVGPTNEVRPFCDGRVIWLLAQGQRYSLLLGNVAHSVMK